MSIFKKLFGKTAEEKTLRPRAPRVTVTPLHRLGFRSGSTDHKLSNISVGGMALFRGPEDKWTGDSEIKGILHVDKDDFEVQARIRYLNEVLAGCEFIAPAGTLARAIEQYLRVEILALSLRKVNPAYMKPDPRGETFWFTDGRQNEFHCVVDAKGLVAYHMTFLGNYVEGGRDRRVRGGMVNEGAVEDGNTHKGSALVDMNRALAPEMVLLAKTFVEHVDKLPMEVRNLVAENLSA